MRAICWNSGLIAGLSLGNWKTRGLSLGSPLADDTGRGYLIAAAAVLLATFPVWLGAAFVTGMPSHDVLYPRLSSFVVNLISIAVCAVVT